MKWLDIKIKNVKLKINEFDVDLAKTDLLQEAG